eukprot:Phypoly_transcript_11361.p1 GENE.Phypoly_transcript_11361~~Phypoly_transcript_11361.p1  ORF type:complete len:268 (+),score=42.74 Phypoly_transcript_11361:223-1026(+)
MMELERVETVPSFDINNIMFSPKLEHSFDEAKTKTTLKNELTSSFGIDARVVELDLYDEDSEDEGEVMLLAMILLQLHGVKFPGGFPDHDQANKKKRQRTSPDQLAILEQIFQTDKMPSQQTRVQLADQLGMSSRRVQIWFQNKRAKVKRGLGKSSDGVAPDSPQLDLDRENSPLLSSSSCLSEPSSPLVPDSSFHGSPSSSSSSPPSLSLSTTPPSPSSAVVPCSPSFPQTPKQLTSQAAQLQFSLSSLAQPIVSLTLLYSFNFCY